MRKPKRCMAPGCSAPSKFRGLCFNCYQLVRRLVAIGETTWERLVKAGKCLARAPAGRKPSKKAEHFCT